MRLIYSLFFYLSLPFVALRLLWRARRNSGYAKRWPERFGKIPFTVKPQGIWWHCVSVGETLAALPLIRKLIQMYPEVPVVVTSMTPTGSAQVIKNLGDTVQHMYIPYDLPHIMASFVKTISPRLVIIMETELWPNMLHYCHAYKVPVLLANGRMSEKSARGYKKLGSLTREMMQNISLIASQNKEDAARFIELGCSPEKVVITGTVKFDITISSDIIEKARIFREKWGKRPVWIAASTHKGEEEIILEAAQQLPDALLLLAPRHPDRANEVLSLCEKAKLETVMRSKGEVPEAKTRVFLIDTLGELTFFYAQSDIAFVGGSLIDQGGHNLLEPAALGLPILTGKYLYNFAEIERLLTKAQALTKIQNAEELVTQIKKLFEDQNLRITMGNAAKKVIEENRGATEKHILLVRKILS